MNRLMCKSGLFSTNCWETKRVCEVRYPISAHIC